MLRMGVDYGRITVREQKTRWEAAVRNLNFNEAGSDASGAFGLCGGS